MNNKILELAKEYKFDNVELLGEYKNLTVYEPYMNSKETSYVGLPHYIIEDKEGNIKMLFAREDVFPIYDFFYSSAE